MNTMKSSLVFLVFLVLSITSTASFAGLTFTTPANPCPDSLSKIACTNTESTSTCQYSTNSNGQCNGIQLMQGSTYNQTLTFSSGSQQNGSMLYNININLTFDELPLIENLQKICYFKPTQSIQIPVVAATMADMNNPVSCESLGGSSASS